MQILTSPFYSLWSPRYPPYYSIFQNTHSTEGIHFTPQPSTHTHVIELRQKCTGNHIYPRKQWQATPILLPGEFHGRRSLQSMGSLRVGWDWETERLNFHFSLSCAGEGNGNPLQCSCLEDPRDGGAWWAAIYGVVQSWTRLKQLSSSSSNHIYTHCAACTGHFLIYFKCWKQPTKWTSNHYDAIVIPLYNLTPLRKCSHDLSAFPSSSSPNWRRSYWEKGKERDKAPHVPRVYSEVWWFTGLFALMYFNTMVRFIF